MSFTSDIPKSNLDMANRLESGREMTRVERAYLVGFLHALEMMRNVKAMRAKSPRPINIKDYEDTESQMDISVRARARRRASHRAI
jgi:hypothetical protein